MAINKLPPSRGIFGSKAFKVGMGYATGGPMGAGAALASDGPAGGMINTAGSIASLGGEKKQTLPTAAPTMAQDQTAMGRRLQAQSVNPEAQLAQGLKALEDPRVPDYVREAYAEPLLRAKHFGKNRMGGIA